MHACGRSSILPFVYGPKRAIGHFLGAKKIIFLIRDIDGPAMAAALAESCQSVILRSPWGRLGSLLHKCKRLRRMRGRFHRWIHLPRCISLQLAWPWFAKVLDPELSGEPQEPALAVLATTRPQTYPGASPRADLPPKKVCNLDPMAPRSRQKRQLPEGPQ